MKQGFRRLGWWLAGSIALLVMLPELVTKGMYVDGLLYATISRNMAEGLGSLWSPYATATLFPEFYEHPPLAFWLQSLSYLVLGDHWWVDKLYGALLLAGSLLLIGRIAYRGLGVHWIPAVGYLLVPLVWWSFANNMLENTVTFFVLLSVWCQHKWIRGGANYWLYGGGLALIFGFLAKGPVALFPLIWLPLDRYFLDPSDMKRGLRGLYTLTALVFGVIVLLIALPVSGDSLLQYLNSQVLQSLNGARASGSRIDMLTRLPEELLPLLLLYGLGFWLNRSVENRDNIRYSLRWILFALCGTLPILVSSKVSIHYFIPAFPFYALALAPLFRTSMFEYLQERFHLRRFRYSGWFIVVILLLFTLIFTSNSLDKPVRDLQTQEDLQLIAEEAGEGTTLGLYPDSLYTLWSLHAYAHRNHHISLAADTSQARIISRSSYIDGYALLTPANQEFFLHAKE